MLTHHGERAKGCWIHAVLHGHHHLHLVHVTEIVRSLGRLISGILAGFHIRISRLGLILAIFIDLLCLLCRLPFKTGLVIWTVFRGLAMVVLVGNFILYSRFLNTKSVVERATKLERAEAYLVAIGKALLLRVNRCIYSVLAGYCSCLPRCFIFIKHSLIAGRNSSCRRSRGCLWQWACTGQGRRRVGRRRGSGRNRLWARGFAFLLFGLEKHPNSSPEGFVDRAIGARHGRVLADGARGW